jgi:DNA-binding transcriptional regulator YiaG
MLTGVSAVVIFAIRMKHAIDPPRRMEARQLRQRMDALNLSVSELALLAGVSRQAVYFWLNGEREVPLMLDHLFVRIEEQPGL